MIGERVVIDASVVLKWIFNEQGTDKALSLINRIESFFSPEHFITEIDAVLTKRVRLREIGIEEANQKREMFRKLPYRLIPYNQIENIAFDLATGFRVSFYDALYIATTIQLKGHFYTSDKRLRNGFKDTTYNSLISLIDI